MRCGRKERKGRDEGRLPYIFGYAVQVNKVCWRRGNVLTKNTAKQLHWLARVRSLVGQGRGRGWHPGAFTAGAITYYHVLWYTGVVQTTLQAARLLPLQDPWRSIEFPEPGTFCKSSRLDAMSGRAA